MKEVKKEKRQEERERKKRIIEAMRKRSKE